ncbi:transcriptional regulator [Empedobacter sp.]|uniref:MerR family transcriptional regulator n=1 Tax=Empedobacter sp. TaxID=1927715 RepID=UPI0028982612|nr:transcriptional regulator [Empedobacter sp.]
MARLTAEKRKEKEEFAKLLFLKEDITDFKELSERTKVSQKTLREWEKEGNWKKLKRNVVLMRDEQLTLMNDELAELNRSIREKKEGSRFADHKESIIRRQLVKDIKDLETEASLAETIYSLKQLLDFVRRNDIEDTKLLANYVDQFIKQKLRS